MPTRPARTPRLPPEQRRQQLLDAALDVLAREGFEAVTVEAVAQRAGVTRPVIYDQFGDLDGLLVALIDREEQRALGPLLAIVEAVPDDQDPDAFLVDAVGRFLEAVREAPTTWRIILMPPDAGSPDFRARVDASRRLIVDHVTELVAWGVEHRGGPAGVDVDLLGRMVVAVGEDAARLVVAHPRRYSPARLAAATGALASLAPRGGVLPPPLLLDVEPRADLAAGIVPPPVEPSTNGRARIPMAERRQQLLGHALAILAQEGFDALTIEALARRAGVSRVVVYRSFGNLQALLLALLRRESRRIRTQLDGLVPDEPGDATPQELLTGSLTRFLETVTTDAMTWRVALQRPESAPKALQRMVARRRASFADRLRPLVAWGLEGLDAPVEDLDVDLLARLLLTVGEELGRLTLTEPDTFPLERLVDSVTRFLSVLPWRAAAAPPRSAPRSVPPGTARSPG